MANQNTCCMQTVCEFHSNAESTGAGLIVRMSEARMLTVLRVVLLPMSGQSLQTLQKNHKANPRTDADALCIG